MESLLPFAGLAILFAIALRFAAAHWDRNRIEHYIKAQGGKVLESRWEPGGPESFGDESASIYAVRYLDHNRNEHAAHCQTSIWTRVVRLFEDRIVHFAESPIAELNGAGSPTPTESRRPRKKLALAQKV